MIPFEYEYHLIEYEYEWSQLRKFSAEIIPEEPLIENNI
jgi:hypothetical protein